MNNRKIGELRKNIDKIDEELLKKLVERFSIVDKISRIKKMEGRNIEDKDREKELKQSRSLMARKLGLEERFVEKLFDLVVHESKKRQICC